MNVSWIAIVALVAAQREPSFINGRVIDSLTRQPIAGVSIVLMRSDALADCTVMKTDQAGAFAFTSVPPGVYRVRAEREGYLPGKLMSADIRDRGTSKDSFVLELTPEAVISGRVTDANGEPAGRVFVRAFDDTRQVAEARTNDLGEYRLFGLAPGAYLINAESYPGPRIEVNSEYAPGRTYPGIALVTPSPPCPDCPGEGIGRMSLSGLLPSGGFIDPRALKNEQPQTVFYPGTTDRAAATPVKVTAGATIDAIDLMLIVR